MQGLLYTQMESKMMSTTERLAVIDASASNIGSKLTDLSSVLAQIASLGGILGALLKWKWPCFAVFVVAWFSHRFAVYTAATLGMQLTSWLFEMPI